MSSIISTSADAGRINVDSNIKEISIIARDFFKKTLIFASFHRKEFTNRFYPKYSLKAKKKMNVVCIKSGTQFRVPLKILLLL